jgi:hypothetical protein
LFPLEVRLSLPNTPNGADEDFRWSVGALGSAHPTENRGRQHRSSACKAGNSGLADLAPDERLTLTKKDSHTGRVARKDVERQTKGESIPRTIYKVLNRGLPPAVALCLILRLPLRYGLPLHIEGCICSTAFERIDVIDDVSRTAAAGSPIGRARMLTLEVVLSSRAAPVVAMPSSPRAVKSGGKTDGYGCAEEWRRY